MMTNKPLDILRERLARGEISLEEFQRLLPHLQSQAAPPSPARAPAPADENPINTLARSLANYFSSDQKPIVVDGLSVGRTFFISKGSRHAMSEIKSLSFYSFRNSINLIATTGTFLTIFIESGAAYKHSTAAMIISGKGNANLHRAYDILAGLTFQQRLGRHLRAIAQNGTTKVSDVGISRDGWISKGKTRVHIPTAWQNKYVVIGTSLGSRENPYEIIVGENGTSVFAKRVRTVAYLDTDIIRYFLGHFFNHADI